MSTFPSGDYTWTPNTTGYTYYTTPEIKPTVDELIAIYKKQFGKDWKRMFAQTVRVNAR